MIASTEAAVLVTGATGFIGSALARRLSADGHRVVGLIRRSSPRRECLAGCPGLDIAEVDDFSPTELDRILGTRPIGTICHLASYGVAAGESDRAQLIAGNVGLTATLIEAAARHSVRRFVQTGSCFEYAAPRDGLPLSEDSPVRPWSVYGAAKSASVHFARTLSAKLGLPLITLRLFGVYGSGEQPQRLVPYLLNRLERREAAELTPGFQVRDFLYIDDAVDAYRTALAGADELFDGRDFNVCTGVPTSIRELGVTAAELLNAPAQLLRWGALPGRPEEPARIVGDPSAFRAATGWAPRFDLREGLRATIDARNHGRI